MNGNIPVMRLGDWHGDYCMSPRQRPITGDNSVRGETEAGAIDSLGLI